MEYTLKVGARNIINNENVAMLVADLLPHVVKTKTFDHPETERVLIYIYTVAIDEDFMFMLKLRYSDEVLKRLTPLG